MAAAAECLPILSGRPCSPLPPSWLPWRCWERLPLHVSIVWHAPVPAARSETPKLTHSQFASLRRLAPPLQLCAEEAAAGAGGAGAQVGLPGSRGLVPHSLPPPPLPPPACRCRCRLIQAPSRFALLQEAGQAHSGGDEGRNRGPEGATCCVPVVLQPGSSPTPDLTQYLQPPLQAISHSFCTHRHCLHDAAVALQANHREVLRQHGIAPQPSLTPGGGGLRARR